MKGGDSREVEGVDEVVHGGDEATGAMTRVIIDTRNTHAAWSTVGSSTNIIESSWQALVDSMEYALLPEV